jgi:hypothetical protein
MADTDPHHDVTDEDGGDDIPRTHAWACATGGALTAGQRARIRQAIRSGYRAVVEGLVSWPLHRAAAPAELPSAPDSKLARTAEEAAVEQGPALLGHGYRTWVLGAALADHDRVAVDPELLYVTGLLHDAGIVRSVTGEDFTVRSGTILIEVCERAGADPERGARAADAAVAHATPGLAVTDDPVGFYVQAGAMADLAGLRMWDLPKGHLRRAYGAYPASGVHKEIPRLVRQEAGHVPDGRFALLRRSGLDLMVVASPTRLVAGVARSGPPPA